MDASSLYTLAKSYAQQTDTIICVLHNAQPKTPCINSVNFCGHPSQTSVINFDAVKTAYCKNENIHPQLASVDALTHRLLRQQIVEEFHRAMEGLNEKYVTAETLCEHVETLTPQWLKHHGSCFNRTRIEWTDKTGHHTSSWLYPLHEIIHMVQDGRIKNMVVR